MLARSASALILVTVVSSCAETAPKGEQPRPLASPSTQAHDYGGEPPQLVLYVDDESFPAEVGTYCSTSGLNHQCQDAIPGGNQSRARATSGRQSIRFEWAWGPATTNVYICRGIDPYSKCNKPIEAEGSIGDTHEMELHEGRHRMTASLQFPDGDASYEWMLVVDAA